MTLLSVIIFFTFIFILILISAFFSSAETAITAASEARIRQLSIKGNKKAKNVENLRKDKEKLISTILIGNNTVNVLASALATSAAIALTGDKGVALATILMTFILVLFAEVLPKSYAFNHADKLSLKIAYPLKFIVFLLSPISWALRKLVVNLLGNKHQNNNNREEELRGLIELHSEQTDEDGKETGAMLSSVLDLGEITIEEIMTHRASVTVINSDDSPEEILDFI